MRAFTRHGGTILAGLVGGGVLILGLSSFSVGAGLPRDIPGIPPDKVADYVHAVIEADRYVYTKLVVERMQAKGITEADEHWEQKHALPLPAQFLRYSGRRAAESGSGIRYGLISLWPIRNGPATEFERTALQAVLKEPDRPYSGTVGSGTKRFFQAVYADLAVSKACVDCHNTHVLSPKRDFKLNDVMGGVVITIPLDH